MKIFLAFTLLFLSAVFFYLSQLHLHPNDFQAAWTWNTALILSPVVAMLFQVKLARERQMSLTVFLTVLAVVNTVIVMGSRVGAWTIADWSHALLDGALPELPGKTVLGGVFFAVIAFVLLQRWWRFPMAMADVLIVGLPIAGAAARVGCLVAGCCYGVPTGTENGVCYGLGTPAYEHQVDVGMIASNAAQSLPVYPIQYFLLAGNLFIFLVLWSYRKRLTQPGALLSLGLLLLAVQRFSMEFFREIATNRGMFGNTFGGLKVAQWFCIGLVLVAVFVLARFSGSPKQQQPEALPSRAGATRMTVAIIVLAGGTIWLKGLLTIAESMMILLSCLPAIFMIGTHLLELRPSRQKLVATTAMLYGATFIFMIQPIDSLINPTPGNDDIRRQWLEVGGSQTFGSYNRVDRDCDGNIVDKHKIKYNATTVDLNSNWQINQTYLKAGIRAAIGNADPYRAVVEDEHFNYFSYGLYGRISYRWIGFSLGGCAFNQHFLDAAPNNGTETSFLPSLSMRIGLADRYSIDWRVFDEPSAGIAYQPLFSLGFANWGFDDPTGDTNVRVAFALTRDGESAFNISSRFPFGNSGFYGDFSGYLGEANMLSLGIRYRFYNRIKY